MKISFLKIRRDHYRATDSLVSFLIRTQLSWWLPESFFQRVAPSSRGFWSVIHHSSSIFQSFHSLLLFKASDTVHPDWGVYQYPNNAFPDNLLSYYLHSLVRYSWIIRPEVAERVWSVSNVCRQWIRILVVSFFYINYKFSLYLYNWPFFCTLF